MAVKVGCCGIPVVETQQTSYLLPRVQTAERYRRQALTLRPKNGPVSFWLAEGRSVYVCFSNDANAHAVANALILKELAGSDLGLTRSSHRG